MLQTLDDALQYWQFDVQTQFARSYRIPKIEQIAPQVPGVTKMECWGYALTRRLRPDETESENIVMIAPPAETDMLAPTLIAGRWLLPDDKNAIVVNQDILRNEPDVKMGDQLVLRLAGRETTWQVVGAVRMVGSSSVVYVNYPYYERVARAIGQASSVQIVTEQHDAGSQERVAKALEAAFERSGLRTIFTQTTASIRQQNEFYFTIIIVLLLVMATLIAAVGALGLMGTMSINVLERTREIGIMRAVGASDGAVLRIVLVEGILIGGLSWLVSALFSFPLGKLLTNAVGMAFFATRLSYRFSMTGVVIWLALVVILSALASFLPARSASRLTVREVLAYE